MFHLFVGTKEIHQDRQYLVNDHYGIQVTHQGSQMTGRYRIHHIIDDSNKEVRYYAFDTQAELLLFEEMRKIPGIGPKSALVLCDLGEAKLHEAVRNFDTSVLEALPGIGAKTAKRILVELKTKLGASDIQKLQIDPKLLKDITKSLVTMGYPKDAIASHLSSYPGEVSRQTLQEVMMWLIGVMK